MSDTILITLDDLEISVRVNARFEEIRARTVMISATEDPAAIFARHPPDVVIVTGSVHERLARELIQLARDEGVSTLGVFEPTEGDPATQAHKLGFTGWLVKPVEADDIVAAARGLIERRRLQQRTGIIGESPAVQEVLVKIEQIAPVSSTVLIEGESGTGKELVAQAIHDLSPRRGHPFIAVNCSALPDTLLESELFGHEKGAFTGAAERRLGRFELADSGTLFLDEVGDMPTSLQVKLLRVLETRKFFRVGGSEPIHVNVRVVAATNRSLKDAVASGAFREDLYFRLNVLRIYLPPLRERTGDIPLLVKRFVRQFSKEHNRSFRGITASAMRILVEAHWPGNVRQLRNLVESMVVLAPGREIDESDIPADVREAGARLLPVHLASDAESPGGKELEFIFRSLVELKIQIEELRRRIDEEPARVELIEVEAARAEDEVHAIDLTDSDAAIESPTVLYQSGMSMAEVEEATIRAALRDSGGNRRKAAERLGIGERTLYRKIKEYDLA